MGILSRFKTIMKSNVHASMEQAADPIKMVNDYMRQVDLDLGSVKAETASVLANERRAKRVLEEHRAEMDKLQRYAVKSVEAGNEADARKFLDRKLSLADKEHQLQSAYDAAAADAAKMRHLQDKLTADRNELEARRSRLKDKMEETKAQQQRNANGSPFGGQATVFDAAEEKINMAHNEAMAIAELRGNANEDLDALFAELDRATPPQEQKTVDEELDAIKQQRQQDR